MGTSQVQIPQALAQQRVLHERVHDVMALLDLFKAHQGLLQPHLQPGRGSAYWRVGLILRLIYERLQCTAALPTHIDVESAV